MENVRLSSSGLVCVYELPVPPGLIVTASVMISIALGSISSCQQNIGERKYTPGMLEWVSVHD
jgi:hypothetical protein